MNVNNEGMKRGFDVLEKLGRGGQMLDQKEILYEQSVKYLFGDIWTHPHLNPRDRTLINLAAMIALARPHGTHSHYRSALDIGFTKEEIMELITSSN